MYYRLQEHAEAGRALWTRLSSCDDDELSGRVIRFHGSVRLGNLIEAIHVIDGYDGVAGGDSVEKLLQYSRG